MERLNIEDLLLIGEVVLDVPGEQLARTARLEAADAALAAAARQRTLARQAATLCHRLVRDRPLPYGNKPVALIAMLELIARNRATWISPTGDAYELATMVERLATGDLPPAAFAVWIRRHVVLE